LVPEPTEWRNSWVVVVRRWSPVDLQAGDGIGRVAGLESLS
jgi:hypothetical protein